MNTIMLDNHNLQIEWYESAILKAFHFATQAYKNPISYEEILLKSGFPFRLQFHPQWCPSAANAVCGINVYDILLNHISFKENMMDMDEPQQEIITKIHEKIDNNIPVLFHKEEAAIILGYETGYDARLIGRSYWNFREKPGLVPITEFPWLFTYLEPKDMEPDFSLEKTILHLTSKQEEDGYFVGITAIEKWIEALENLDLANLKNEDLLLAIQSNAHLYYTLFHARKTLLQFLQNPFQDYDFKALIQFETSVSILETGLDFIKWPWEFEQLTDWHESIRNEQIQILLDFKENEKKLIKIIEDID